MNQLHKEEKVQDYSGTPMGDALLPINQQSSYHPKILEEVQENHKENITQN